MIAAELATMDSIDSKLWVKMAHDAFGRSGKFAITPETNLGVRGPLPNFAKYGDDWSNVTPRSPAGC